MSKPEISVIVPHYDDPERLGRCLSALASQTLPPSKYEVIVADNASPVCRDELDRIIAGRARLVVETARGAGPARNAGVACASGALLAFTDADCLPERDWLEAGCAALARTPVVGGKVRVLTSAPGARSGTEAFELVFAFDNRRYVEERGFSVTANLFCTRAVFDAVGGFRNGVPEDLDWCRRSTARGFQIGYAPSAVVWHPARSDWQELRNKWRRLNAEAFALARQGQMGRLRWTLRALALPASIAIHAPRVFLHRDLNGAGERMRALATLARLRTWRTLAALRLVLPRREPGT